VTPLHKKSNMSQQVIDITNEDALTLPNKPPAVKKQKMTLEDVMKEEEPVVNDAELFKTKLSEILGSFPFSFSNFTTLCDGAMTDNIYVSQEDFDFMVKMVVEARIPAYAANLVFYELIFLMYEKVPKNKQITAEDDEMSVVLMNEIVKTPSEITQRLCDFHRGVQACLQKDTNTAINFCIDMFKRLCMFNGDKSSVELNRAKVLMSGHVATYYVYLKR
jgi:hypothetical protein